MGVHQCRQRSFLEASTNCRLQIPVCEPQHTSSHHCDLFRFSELAHSECFCSFDVALCFRTLASLLSASVATVSVALCHFLFSFTRLLELSMQPSYCMCAR